MAQTLTVDIVTPVRLLASHETGFVSVPGIEGDFGVMKGHVPLVSALGSGIIDVKDTLGAKGEQYVIAGGYVDVSNEKVIVLADHAVDVSTIDKDEVSSTLTDYERELGSVATDDNRVPFLKSEIAWCKLRLAAVE